MRLPAILSAVFAVVAVLALACGDDGAEPTQTPSPTATVVASPTASPEPATTPDGDRIPLTTAEIVRLLRPSVVHVLIEGTTFSVFGQPIPTEGVGTGFIIDDEHPLLGGVCHDILS